MNKAIRKLHTAFTVLSTAVMVLTSCNLQPSRSEIPNTSATDQADEWSNATPPTPVPVRPTYKPGELVDYTAQTGDTLPALAARFNTTVDEILLANTFIPRDATTMPPGMGMKIPIYYRALWGSPFQIIPDHAFVNGPADNGFNTAAFVASQAGWLKNYRAYVSGSWRSGAELVDYVAVNYSVSPRLLLAILEYQGGALTQAEPPTNRNLLGLIRPFWDSHYLQIVLAANTLNNGYYAWRIGTLIEFEDANKILIRPDPWQNAGSAALQYYYSRMFTGDEFTRATGSEGLSKTYADLFGDPWLENFELIPGSLQQPDLNLPFPNNQTWSYTGGPHTSWGTGEPFAAVDFAPPQEQSGCYPAKPENFATSVADGLVVRSTVDGVALDLDRDGNERTGWVIYYLHLATDQRAPLGADLKAGDKIGYPSCEGGRSTGTHVHVARKYNGEWIVADSVIPFTMNGWVTRSGSRAYLGTLAKGGAIVIACECGDAYTSVNANFP
ncbi:MAG: LysM peptidoglycan-binding domain-containing protein [Anaerolineales bacterium]|nr:LysM peptidoglycan-binding domain-containing protein [Anaerolineales bacterium]